MTMMVKTNYHDDNNDGNNNKSSSPKAKVKMIKAKTDSTRFFSGRDSWTYRNIDKHRRRCGLGL